MHRLAPLCFAPWLFAGCGAQSEPPRQNLVLIVVDTLRADHADPAAGRASTPALERLAADGVRFPNAFCQTPITLPSHASLFSSRPPFESGVKLNLQPVPGELPLFAKWLSRLGYRTSAVVSLASMWPIVAGKGLERGFRDYVLDGNVDCWPADRVESEVETLLDSLASGGEPFFLFAHFSDPHDPYSAHGTAERHVEVLLDGVPLERMLVSEFGFRSGVVELAPGTHTLDLRADHPFLMRVVEPRGPEDLLPMQWQKGKLREPLSEARVLIANPLDQPVSCDLWLWLQDALTEEENRARYRLEVEYADKYVGELIENLKRRGLYEQSLVVFTSDHGEALGEHGVTGHVVNLYEEMLHVPLVMKLPRGHAASARLSAASGRLVRLIDLVPTLLDVLELPAFPGQQGVSLLDEAPAQLALAETHRPIGPRELFSLRDERHKLIYAPEERRFELYDLTADPGELHDLFATQGEQFAERRKELERIAALSAERGTAPPVLDPKAARRLEALGY